VISSTLHSAGELTAAPPFDLWNLIQFGLLGVGFVCLAAGKWIVPEWVLRRAEERHAKELAEVRAERDGYKGQVERLQVVTIEQMIPALTRATEVAATYNEELARQRWSHGERA
jgi:hypothetical protein